MVHEHGKKRGQAPAVKGNLADQKEENAKIKIKGKDTKELIFPRKKVMLIFAG